jgi:two-component system, NarL family, nitrate/nitrite response regulator NarL
MEPESPRRAVLRKQGDISSAGDRETEIKEPETVFRIFVADRDVMSSNLLATTLTRDSYCQATAIASNDLLQQLELLSADMVVLGAEATNGLPNEFDLVQAVKRAHPEIPIVLLLSQSTRESIMAAFRSGAKGVLSRQEPVAGLLDCVERVRKGYIWAGSNETTMLLDAVRSFPFPSLSQSNSSLPLTYRERQVVKFAARGKSNKVIAIELALSEHTVKNYLYRAFEKLGVSNRVELLFYLSTRGNGAVSSGLDEGEN